MSDDNFPTMSQFVSKEHMVHHILTRIWDIPAEVRQTNGISVNFLLKWHVDYLRDKTHTDINPETSRVRPYIYRDMTKFYIVSYGGAKNSPSKLFWLSFRKVANQPHGYVLIKPARNTTNDNSI